MNRAPRSLVFLLLLPCLTAAADDPPVALSVAVESLGRGAEGTVVGIVVQVAPEDRERLGERVRLVMTLSRDGDLVDRQSSVVALESDGSAMLYKELPVGAYQLRVDLRMYDIASGQDKILTSSPDDAKDIDISPDGRWLVFTNRDEKKVLRVIPTSGGDPRVLCSYEHLATRPVYPTWIGGGRYILFTRTTSALDEAVETWEIARVPVEGGEIQSLGLEMTEFRHFSAHPDGQHIVFHSRGSKIRGAEVWVMENFLPINK